MAWPDFQQLISQAWGWGVEGSGFNLGIASNIIFGGNPPYSVGDFLAFYPQFGGTPLNLTGVITTGSPIMTGIQTSAGVLPGQAIAPYIDLGNGLFLAGCFPVGTTVVSVDSDNQITLSNVPITTAYQQISVYNKPYVPIAALTAFTMLATSSLSKNLWGTAWEFGIALFIAHYCTLYLRSLGGPITSGAQLAAASVARGIVTSKAAGNVSMGISLATQGSGLAEWGAWQETEFGVQFITMARIMGSGPVMLY